MNTGGLERIGIFEVVVPCVFCQVNSIRGKICDIDMSKDPYDYYPKSLYRYVQSSLLLL